MGSQADGQGGKAAVDAPLQGQAHRGVDVARGLPGHQQGLLELRAVAPGRATR